MEAEAFMAEVDALVSRAPALSPLAAALLIAAAEGVAMDTRSFAKTFGVAHALVLRTLAELEDAGLATAPSRDARTQRARIALTTEGERLSRERPRLAA